MVKANLNRQNHTKKYTQTHTLIKRKQTTTTNKRTKKMDRNLRQMVKAKLNRQITQRSIHIHSHSHTYTVTREKREKNKIIKIIKK